MYPSSATAGTVTAGAATSKTEMQVSLQPLAGAGPLSRCLNLDRDDWSSLDPRGGVCLQIACQCPLQPAAHSSNNFLQRGFIDEMAVMVTDRPTGPLCLPCTVLSEPSPHHKMSIWSMAQARFLEHYPTAELSITHGFPWRTFLSDDSRQVHPCSL